MISAAAELRDVGSVLEAPTARDALATQSAGVNVPVLIVLGSADLLTCGPGEIECRSADGVAEAERGLFGPRASVRAVLVPGSGHALNLERTHTLAWTAISDFLTELPR
ncbi:hypothetical protein [Nocardia sp. IFM 10818]